MAIERTYVAKLSERRRREESYLWSGIKRQSAAKEVNPILARREARIGEWTATSPSLQTRVRSVKAEVSRNFHKVCDRNVVWSILSPLSEINVCLGDSLNLCNVEKCELSLIPV